MMIQKRYILFVLVLAGTNVFSQGSGAGKATRSAPATTTQQPTTASPVPQPAIPQSSMPTLSAPKYSPTQLDFGAIDYIASSKRTFSLTVPLAGEITLEFPAGSFVAAELRRVPPLNFGKNQSAPRALVPPMKPMPTSKNGQDELYKWNFAAGEGLQLDILFAPSFSRSVWGRSL